jgi:hypothetical protein
MAVKAESWSKVNSLTVFLESMVDSVPSDIPSKQEVGYAH